MYSIFFGRNVRCHLDKLLRRGGKEIDTPKPSDRSKLNVAIFIFSSLHSCRASDASSIQKRVWASKPEHIYNPITAMGFSAMFTFQLDNTKR